MLLYESGKLHIAENRKKIMLIPLIVILIAAICLVVYSFTADSAVNVGTDFTGGYKMRVKVGSRLTDETYDEYSSKIISIAENLTDEEGNKYGIKVTDCERYGTNNDSIAISYLGVASDDEMLDVVNPALKQALIDEILYVSPELTYSDGSIVAKYDGTILNGNIGDIKCEQLRKLGVAVTGYEYDADTLTVSVSSPVADSLKDEVSKALVLRDEYVGSVDSSGFVSSAVSSELLQRAVLAVVLAIACMLIYIWIRFEPVHIHVFQCRATFETFTIGQIFIKIYGFKVYAIAERTGIYLCIRNRYMPGNIRVAFKSANPYLSQIFRAYVMQLVTTLESSRAYGLQVSPIAYIAQILAAEEHIITDVLYHVLILAAKSIQLCAISK